MLITDGGPGQGLAQPEPCAHCVFVHRGHDKPNCRSLVLSCSNLNYDCHLARLWPYTDHFDRITQAGQTNQNKLVNFLHCQIVLCAIVLSV